MEETIDITINQINEIGSVVAPGVLHIKAHTFSIKSHSICLTLMLFNDLIKIH